MAATLSIREVARRAGVSSSTLRYYERRDSIAPVGRDANGRVYAPQVLERLWIIGYFQQAGYTLAQIAELLDSGPGWRDSARRKREVLEAQIGALRAAQQLLDDALACGCDDLEGCARQDANVPSG